MGEGDGRRRNYTGRALLHHMEKLFPDDAETAERIVNIKVKGKLPRQVAQGLINSIESCSPSKLEPAIRPHVERHLVTHNREMDYDAFAIDGSVRVIVAHAIKKLGGFFENMSEEDQKQWLLGNIISTERFDEMKRDLSEEELNLIISNILNV